MQTYVVLLCKHTASSCPSKAKKLECLLLWACLTDTQSSFAETWGSFAEILRQIFCSPFHLKLCSSRACAPLWRTYRALLRRYRALLQICRALVCIRRALLRIQKAFLRIRGRECLLLCCSLPDTQGSFVEIYSSFVNTYGSFAEIPRQVLCRPLQTPFHLKLYYWAHLLWAGFDD